MKKIITILATGAFAAWCSAALVTENFDSGFSGWSQSGHYSADATGGTGGSGGVSFATNAVQNRGAMHQTGVSAPVGVGNTITVKSDFEFSLTGDALNGAPNGVNNALFGLILSDTATWWDGARIGTQIARRADGIWGIRGIEFSGWNNNSLLGLSNGGAAGTSAYNTMEMVMIDNGSTYDVTFNVYNSASSLVFSSGTNATTVASGTTLYGGYFNGFDVGTVDSIGERGKISDVTFDNFSLESIPEPGTLGLIGAFGGAVLFIRRRFMM